jgi:hypothetical protein
MFSLIITIVMIICYHPCGHPQKRFILQQPDNNTYEIVNISSNTQLFQNNNAYFNDLINVILSDSDTSSFMFSNRMYFTNY